MTKETKMTKEAYVAYVLGTLVPDLLESGRHATAFDFGSMVRMLTKPGQKDEESFKHYLRTRLVPDLKWAGYDGTAEDLETGLELLGD